MADLDLSYVSLIDKVIGEYNDIHDKLLTKNTALQNVTLPTSQYAAEIDKLTLITPVCPQGCTKTHFAGHTVKGLFEGETTLNLGASSFVRDSDKFLITATLTEDLFIDHTGVNLVGTINNAHVVDLNLTGDLASLDATNYTVTKTTGNTPSFIIEPEKIVKSITVKESQVTVDKSKENGYGISFNSALSSTVELDTEGTVVKTLDEGTNAFAIKFKSTADLKNISLQSKAKVSISEGYTQAKDVAAADTTITETLQDMSETDDITVYIKSGGVELKSTTGGANDAKATIAAPDGFSSIFVSDTDTTTPSITLNASVTGNLGLQVKYDEGYVKPVVEGQWENIDSSRISISGSSVKLKRSTVSELTTFTPVITTSSDHTSMIADASDSNVYSVTINTTEQIASNQTVTDGYVVADDLGTKPDGTPKSAIKIAKAEEKTVKIKKSSGIQATAAITNYAVGGDAITTSSTNGYHITVTPTISNTVSLAQGGRYGYVTSNEDIDASDGTASTNKTKDIYINRGSVTLAAPTITMETINREDGKDAEKELVANPFLTEIPEAGDYLKFSTSASTASFIPGYIAQGPTSVASTNYYIPKATFSWTKISEDSEEEALQVLTGGYVPSGFITEISSIEDLTGYNASVQLGMNVGTQNFSILNAVDSKVIDDYYKITVNPTINAGYISAANAADTLLNREWYVKKGKVTPTATLTFSAGNEFAGTVNRATDGKYSITVEAVAGANYGAEASVGYIEDVTTLGDAATETKSAKINLNTATFEESTHTTNVDTTAEGGVLGVSANDTTEGLQQYKNSTYKIVPKISSCSVSFSVAQAGYISNSDVESLKFESTAINHEGERNAFFIKAAADTATLSQADTSSLVSNIENGKITVNTTGSTYSVNVGGKVKTSITGLDQGYYGAAEVNAIAGSEKEVVIPTTTFSLNKGTVTVVNGDATAKVTSTKTDLLYTTNVDTEDEDATFAKISSAATVTSVTTITEGYIKEGEATEGTSTVSGEAYIKLFETTKNSYSGETNYNFTVGSNDATVLLSDVDTSKNDSVTISTEGKFMSKDTVVTLNDHAMGKSVAAKLLELQARMNGVR